MSDLLLDTCAVLWLAKGSEIAPAARDAVRKKSLHVSPITAWEIANLVRKSRLALTMPVASWFRQVLGAMAAAEPELSADILVNSCELPGTPPNDPADRIIIATARNHNLTVVTRDNRILDYARSGHVRTLVC